MTAGLLLIIHFHQPVGNFDSVIKRVHDRCYKPFLDIVSQYPDLKFSMHFSGCLLEWFEKNTPSMLDLIKKLVKRGQVEIIGGGFYEPVLSIIPERDRAGQIAMMNGYVKSCFGRETRGAWIAERVWEPELVSTLSANGIDYTALDDMHFIYAGLKKEDTYGYFISENNGRSVRIFPSDKELRYVIPFSEPDRPISYMRGIAEKKEGAIFTYGDDAEKFGEWPGTYKWVFEDKWLTRFFDLLSKNNGWLTTRTVSECLKERKPLGRIYLPTASYEEMLEWALPPDASMALHDIKEEIKKENKYERYGPFIRGGFFRNFLAKYEESNQMHKRMLYVSDLVEKCAQNGYPLAKISQARKELYKGQCNCSYWHGVFGGLYLYHLRKAVYEHILKAEKMCAEMAAKTKAAPRKAEVMDFDADGSDEIILQNNDIWTCIKPSRGGSIVELDSKDAAFNMLNVLTRYKETYHRNIVVDKETAPEERISIHDKEKAIEHFTGKIIYDRQRRAMFMDHFFEEGTSLEDFEDMNYKEAGDFADSPYDFKLAGEKLIMKRKGAAYGMQVCIKKEISLNGPALKVSYSIRNMGQRKQEFWFGAEVSFIMPEADSSIYAYVLKKKDKDMSISSRGAVEKITKIEVSDEKKELGMSLLFSKECDLWRFPIKTISQSEKAYEENYQGSVLVPNWHFALEPQKNVNFEVELKMNMEKKL